MKAQICYACHMVRGCKGCCNTCEKECNAKHDCSRQWMTETEGWQWYDAVTSVLSKPEMFDYVPEEIRRKVENERRKPIQLNLDFRLWHRDYTEAKR